MVLYQRLGPFMQHDIQVRGRMANVNEVCQAAQHLVFFKIELEHPLPLLPLDLAGAGITIAGQVDEIAASVAKIVIDGLGLAGCL